VAADRKPGADATWTSAPHTVGDGRVLDDDVSQVGRYVIERPLGAGGMGAVYAARDPVLGRRVALKLIASGASARAAARLVREAQAMARVSDPNVVPVFDAGVDGGRVYIAMELVDGVTLDVWLHEAPRAPRAIVDAFAAAGRGLAAAHRAGLAHRDFKPENVMVGRDGRIRVVDFGLARAPGVATPDPTAVSAETLPADGSITVSDDVPSALSPEVALTATGAVLGTPRYMSPEQWRGEPGDARSDQFSFCVALARALVGAHPFEDRTSALLRESVINGRLKPIPSSVSAPLRAVLRQGMALDPALRLPSMDAVVGALAPARGRRRRIAAAAAAVAVAAGVAVAIGAGNRPRLPSVTAPAAAAAAPAAPLRVRRVTSRGDIKQAAMSPAGDAIALISGDSLIVRGFDAGAEERVLLESGVLPHAVAWSPDGRTVAVTTGDDIRTRWLTLVDATTGAWRTLRGGVGAGFALTSPTEIVGFYFGSNDLTFYDLGHDLKRTRTCTVPGNPTWLHSVRRQPTTGDLFVEAIFRDGTRGFLRTDAGCHAFRTVARGPDVRSLALLPGADRVIVHSRSGDDAQVQELAGDGTALGPARTIDGDVRYLAGVRPDGSIVHVNGNDEWRLSSLAADGTATEIGVGTVSSWFALSPDRAWVAHVEWEDRGGSLRVQALDRLRQRTRPILRGVHSASWSLDGKELAVIVEAEGRYTLALVDPHGAAAPRPVATWDEPVADAVWIDDHRIAVRPQNNQSYRWVDIRTHAQGTLIDPASGWTFSLVRSPDGTLAFYWNRRHDGPSLWTMRPGAAPIRLAAAPPGEAGLAWTADGRAVLSYSSDTGALRRIDVATGRLEERPHIPVPAGMQLVDVIPAGDRLIVQVWRPSADVYLSAAQ